MAVGMAIGQLCSRSHPLASTERILDLPLPDRLEVALDNALLLKAMDAGRIFQASHGARGLLSPGSWTAVWISTQNYCVYDRTKHGMRLTFEQDGVRERYSAAGWSDMSVKWDYPQSRGMVFRFRVAKPAPPDTTLVGLYDMMSSMAEPLGVIVGRDEDWFITAVDDMRLAAKCMRFDLDASPVDRDGTASWP